MNKKTHPQPNMYYRHISSERKWTDLRLREVWRYRDLIVLFTKRTFALSYKQTILGPLWLFLNPFLTSVVYTVVFGQIAGIRTDGLPQLLFYLGSTAIWTYFSSCVLGNSYTFHSNADIFGKVYFPRLTVPISQVASNLIRFAIQISMVLAVLVYYVVRREVQPHFAAWPLILLVLLQLGAMGMGVGLIISSLTVKYRDLSILVSFGVRLWMYATPVIYPLSQLPAGWIRTVVLLNPVTAPIELFRFALLGRGIFVWSSYLLSWVFTLCVLVFGMMVFTRVEKNFMDMV